MMVSPVVPRAEPEVTATSASAAVMPATRPMPLPAIIAATATSGAITTAKSRASLSAEARVP